MTFPFIFINFIVLPPGEGDPANAIPPDLPPEQSAPDSLCTKILPLTYYKGDPQPPTKTDPAYCQNLKRRMETKKWSMPCVDDSKKSMESELGASGDK